MVVGMALLWAAGALAGARPHAVITAAPPARTTDSSAAFEFRASERAPFTYFECRLDGSRWRACESPASYTQVGGGDHRFEVRLAGLNADSSPALHVWTVARREEATTCGSAGTCANPGQPADPAPARPAEPEAGPQAGPGAGPDAAPAPSRDNRRRDVDGCAYGANRTGEVRDALIVRATVCLLNRERSRAGLRRVRSRPTLATAARRHARDMVVRKYFAHASADGDRVADRVRRAGYLRGARYWTLGEILAWGSSNRSTPASIVRAWMESDTHRVIVLRRDFRDVGVDVVRGTPHPRIPSGGTFVAEFGRRA